MPQPPTPMHITRIKASNFKSFDQLDVELRPFNLVVGANAAGKSNFLEIFRFLRDLVAEGPENAVSLQGGMEYVQNLQVDRSRPVSLELSFPCRTAAAADDSAGLASGTYSVELRPVGGAPGFEIAYEPWRGCPEIALFDLDPKLPKKAAPITGRAQLEPDGSNLALVLRNLLQDPESRDAFLRLLRDVLPFVEDLKVERFADKSLLIAARERFSGMSYLPASFLSDGTIHLAALIVALYFHDAAVMIVEEPERNLHPQLLSRIVRMMIDASRKKQIVATTHNPEMVKHADLADLLLVQRDERGFSRIVRPVESEELKVFLQNDLGVDELYVQNLLGVGHGI